MPFPLQLWIEDNSSAGTVSTIVFSELFPRDLVCYGSRRRFLHCSANPQEMDPGYRINIILGILSDFRRGSGRESKEG